MLSLRQTLYAQLPEWAQPRQAVLRYVLHRRSLRRGWGLLGRSGGVAAIVGLVMISWLAYRAHSPLAVGDSCGSALLAVLYFPMLILQVVLLMLALLGVSDAVTTEQQRGTWELFRVTSHGTEKLVLTRWVAVFYQMRFLFVVLMVPRLIFAGLMLIDIASYRGHYLTL
jgi:ABC-type transport system involved in cytochrome c biogenesis permease component